MKPLFDPKWLPTFHERHLAVVALSPADILDNIRRAVKTMREQPMILLDMSTLSNHIYPIGADGMYHFSHTEPFHPAALGPGISDPSLPMAEAREKWFTETCQANMATLVNSLDLSEYAAPDEKRTINKALRKKRDAQKASQNARGRKWWEHR